MTYTITTWTTTAVARVKADFVAVYRKADGTDSALDASMVLAQTDDRGGRRTILGVVDTATCEVIPATDVAGFVELVGKAWWQSRPHRIELGQLPPAPTSNGIDAEVQL